MNFANISNVSLRIARTLCEHMLLASLLKVFACVLLPFFDKYRTFTCILRTCLYLFSVLTCESWCFISGFFQSIHLCSQIHCLISPLCFHQISVNEQDKWLVFHSRFEHYPYQAYWCNMAIVLVYFCGHSLGTYIYMRGTKCLTIVVPVFMLVYYSGTVRFTGKITFFNIKFYSYC